MLDRCDMGFLNRTPSLPEILGPVLWSRPLTVRITLLVNPWTCEAPLLPTRCHGTGACEHIVDAGEREDQVDRNRRRYRLYIQCPGERCSNLPGARTKPNGQQDAALQ